MQPQRSKPLPTTTAPITPSQSPPQSPSFSSARWRTPGSVPPQKRRRLSTPRRAGSSSVQDRPIDPDQAKAESERRMLDVWDRLAERYSRRIDEDDVVDLVTGDVIEDRGVLRSMDRWEVGRSPDEDEGNDDRSAVEEEEEEGVLIYRPEFASHNFRKPHIISIGYLLFAIAVTVYLWVWMSKENRQRALSLENKDLHKEIELSEEERLKLGDRDVNYRYVL